MHEVLLMHVVPGCRLVSELAAHEGRSVIHMALITSLYRLIGRLIVGLASIDLLILALLYRLHRLHVVVDRTGGQSCTF